MSGGEPSSIKRICPCAARTPLLSWLFGKRKWFRIQIWVCGMVEDAAKALENKPTFDTWTEAFLDLLHQVQENKVLVMNVYRSISREQVEQYLYKLLDPMLREFMERGMQEITVQDDDVQFIVDFYKYALVGMALEWIRKDMKEDPVRMTERLNLLIRGDFQRALNRFRTDRSPSELDD